MTKKNLLVTVSDDHKSKIDELAAKLESKGLAVSGVLKSIGVISGNCDQKKLSSLKKTPGVQSIEEEPVFKAN